MEPDWTSLLASSKVAQDAAATYLDCKNKDRGPLSPPTLPALVIFPEDEVQVLLPPSTTAWETVNAAMQYNGGLD